LFVAGFRAIIHHPHRPARTASSDAIRRRRRVAKQDDENVHLAILPGPPGAAVGLEGSHLKINKFSLQLIFHSTLNKKIVQNYPSSLAVYVLSLYTS